LIHFYKRINRNLSDLRENCERHRGNMSSTKKCSKREPPDQGHLVSVRPRLKFQGRGGTSDVSRSGSGKVGIQSFDDDLSSQSSSVTMNQVTTLKHLLDSELAKVPSSSASSSVESFGPVQMPLPAQALQMPMPDKDLQIALLEEELNLVKRMAELERRKQGANLLDVKAKAKKNNDVLSGFGSVGVPSEPDQTREDVYMYQQIENARRDEVSRLMGVKSKESLCKTRGNKVTTQQIRQMLERKKKNELSLRAEMMNSSASNLKKNIENVDTQEIFESDDDIDLDDPLVMGAVKSSRHERYVFDPPRTDCVDIGSFHGENKGDILHRPDTLDMDSILGENAREQQKIWEEIQNRRREEEENMKGMKHQEVVKEQEQILRQIQEQNIAKKKEEELTFKLLAEMSLNDQQQMMYPSAKATNTKAAAATPFVSSTAFPPLESHNNPAGAWGGGGWSVVGEKAKEKMASLKYAAELDLRKKQNAAQTEAMEEWRKGMMVREEEERRRQLRQWEESQKVKVVKNGKKSQGSDEVTATIPCPTLREFMVEGAGQSRGSRAKGKDGQGGSGSRELGARRKSDSWQESLGARRRLNENQKSRVDAQERDYLARAEQAALSQEWENATRRKEARGASASRVQEEAGHKSKNKKYLSQKTRQR